MRISEILTEKWFWIIVLSLILITVVPLLIVYLILLLPAPLNGIVTICIIIAWGVVAGYKEWIKERGKKEMERS